MKKFILIPAFFSLFVIHAQEKNNLVIPNENLKTKFVTNNN